MKQSQSVLIACLVSALYSTPALAATWDAKTYNPKPAKDDVILPMPCDGKMVFRVVGTGTKDPLEDKSIVLGSDDSPEGYASHTMPSYIAGGFVNKNKERYFLMAKYEVSKMQYDAVMGKNCPSASADAAKPATNVSWFDAVEFTRKYSEWLMKNAKAQLPKEDNVVGFVRLPTNNEWEFAARGGNLVSDSEFRDTTFPLGDNELYLFASFAGSQSSNGKLQPIGKPDYPNPLGLFDMLGNASEMMLDAFKVNKINHYHGQTGSMIVRGGHYLTAEEDISSALKNEFPLYSKEGVANKAPFIGFRTVLTSPMVLTSRSKTQELAKEWEGLGQDSKSANNQQSTKPNVVNKIQNLSNAVEDKKLKKELQDLQGQLRASNQKRDEQRDKAIASNLELGGFLCAAIVDKSWSYRDSSNIIQQTEAVISEIESVEQEVCQEDASASECESVKALKQQKQTELQSLRQATEQEKKELDALTLNYGRTLINVENHYPFEALQKQFDRMSFKKKRLESFINVYWKHIQQYKSDHAIARDKWIAECTEQHQKNLSMSNHP